MLKKNNIEIWVFIKHEITVKPETDKLISLRHWIYDKRQNRDE